MKKINLLFLVLILMYSMKLSGQIQQDCNGNVGIGGTPVSSKLRVVGNVSISGDLSSNTMSTSALTFNNFISASGVANIKTDWNYYAVNLIPTSNNSCYLGYADKRFYKVYCYDLDETSDERQKDNIRQLTGSLDKILNLRGISYDLKPEYILGDSLNMKIKDDRFKENKINNFKNQIGFLAQEVEKILPNVVSYDDSTDVYGISYTRIIPVVVEAIKEQQLIIEGLQKEIQELKNNSGSGTKLKSATVSENITEIQDNSLTHANALYQNSPNPFSQSTTIEYFLTDNVQKAMICIYDMNGTQLKCILLHLSGYGNITINGSELKAGMYMYSLITDEQLIDTKRMVLTD